MKVNRDVMIILCLVVFLLPVSVKAEDKQSLKTAKDKMSYAIGASMGYNLHRLGMDLDSDLLVKGLQDGYGDKHLLLTTDELQRAMTKYYGEMRKKQAATTSVAKDNKKAGLAFLEENKKTQGVVTLPSGLQYKILKEGTGKMPTLKDRVDVRYRGTLIDGTEIGSSDASGKPMTLKVAEALTGWRDVLQLMPVGSKWQLFIPPELAYGDRGAMPFIGPDTTLIYELELVDIK